MRRTSTKFGIVLLFCAATTIASPAQIFTTLHSFDGSDGTAPAAVLIQASDGKVYGTALNGGAYNYGTVFKIALGGTLATLHSFDGADGAYPWAGVIQASDGNFYGTTQAGGAHGGPVGHGLQNHSQRHADYPAQLRRH